MSELKYSSYNKKKYHVLHPQALYRDMSKTIRTLSINGKACIICQTPLIGKQSKYCSICKSKKVKKCSRCGKLREVYHRFCEDCRMLSFKESKKNSSIRFRTSQEYRDWFKENEQLPKTKARHARAQRKYLHTVKGKANSDRLHLKYREKKRLCLINCLT